MSEEQKSRLGSIGYNVWQLGRNTLLSTAEYVTPVLKQSAFTEKGVLTPEEFVASGDHLVLRCPTWQWSAGDPKNAKPYLPPDKQFLITKNVPCQKRACQLGSGAEDEETIAMAMMGGSGDDDDEAWVATHTSHEAAGSDAANIPSAADVAAAVDVSEAAAAVSRMAVSSGGGGASSSAAVNAAEASLEDDFGGSALEADDPSALDDADLELVDGDEAIVKTRTYDVSITYDKYYQCGRVWLYGYTEARQPLTQEQILEDISSDHALKTVTLEAHPHIATGAGLHASIHPCKHAHVMKKLSDEMRSSGKEVKPDLHYLFLFLKFIGSICPTIEYDYTLSVDGL